MCRDCEPMDDVSAAYYSALELEQCRCPRDTAGYPSIDNVNDACEWHGEQIWRDIDSGEFWRMQVRQLQEPGEEARPAAPCATGGQP